MAVLVRSKTGAVGLTRRQFLQVMGATVGGAAVMNTMTAWGLLETSAQTEPARLPRNPDGGTVIVLGAGPGGCAVAYELTNLGYDVTVLEAQGHVGGHILTVRRGTRVHEYGGEEQVCAWDDGLWFDAGPSRVPFYHRGVLHYFKQFNIPLVEYELIDHNAWMYAEGVAGALSGRKMRVGQFMADLAGYTSELLAKATSQSALDQVVSAEDRDRLIAYLVDWGMISPTDLSYRGSNRRGYTELPGVGAPGVVGKPYALSDLLPYANSIVEVQSLALSAIPTYDWQSTLLHPVNGMGQLADEFQEALGDRIKLNSPVTEIHQDQDQVRIVYRDEATGQTRQVTGDYCVCNIPLSVLVNIPADFSSDMQAAIQGVPYAMAIRMGMAFRRRFWEEDDWIYGGQSFFNVPEVGIIDYPDFGYNGEKGVLLGLYAFNIAAANVSRRSNQERVELALEYGSKLHPTYREDFESAVSVAWHRMPYELGAWPDFGDVARAQAYPRLLKPDGRIYLVGEQLSHVNAWMEGAIQAAWYQVEQLHRRAMQRG